jgi:hypothetical protein
MSSIKFEPRSDKCMFGFVKVGKATHAVRGIKEAGGWRIDRCEAICGTWTPWEAINTESYPNFLLARKAIERFYDEVALSNQIVNELIEEERLTAR